MKLRVDARIVVASFLLPVCQAASWGADDSGSNPVPAPAPVPKTPAPVTPKPVPETPAPVEPVTPETSSPTEDNASSSSSSSKSPVPNANAILVQVWSSPELDWDPSFDQYYAGPNVALFEAIQQVQLALGDSGAIQWDMKQFVSDSETVCSDPSLNADPEECINSNCVNQGKYCLDPPTDDGHHDTFNMMYGQDLLRESLRRMCVWDIAKYDHNPALYLDYIFHSHQAKCDLENYSTTCMNKVYQLANLDGVALAECSRRSGGIYRGDNLLFLGLKNKEEALELTASSIQNPFIYIHDTLLPAQALTDPSLLLDAICDNIPVDDKPDACFEGLGEALEEQVEEEIINMQEGVEEETPVQTNAANGTSLGDQALKEALEEEEQEFNEEEIQEMEDESEELMEEFKSTGAPTIAPTTEAPTSSPTGPGILVLIERANHQYEIDAANVTNMKYTPVVNTTIIELWTTPLFDWDTDKGRDEENGYLSDGPNKLILQRLQQLVRDFVGYAVFRPRVVIYTKDEVCSSEKVGLKSAAPNEKDDDCAQMHCSNHGRYCAKGPDDWLVTGRSLVEESLRRLCVAQVAPQRFFRYWAEFHRHSCDDQNVGEECITRALTNAHIPQDQVNLCMENSGGLDKDRDNILFERLLQIQGLTFEYQRTVKPDMPLELPMALIDQEQQTNYDYRLYPQACGALHLSPGEDTSPVCKIDLFHYGQNFTAKQNVIFGREAQLEKDIAEASSLDKPPTISTNNHPPIVEVWTSPILDWKSGTDSSDGPNIALFDKMKELVIAFGDDVIFRPQFYMYTSWQICSLDLEGKKLVGKERENCINENCGVSGTYCDYGTENENISGQDLVDESLARMCLWETYGRNDRLDDDVIFFDYLAGFHSKKCHGAERRWDCALDVMKSLKVDHYGIRDCKGATAAKSTENKILQDLVEVQDAKFFTYLLDPADLPIVMINGVPLDGGADLTIEELFDIVCTEFPKTSSGELPDMCQGDMEDNLGEDYNFTVAPSYEIAELEGKLGISSTATTATLDAGEAVFTTAPTEEAPSIVPTSENLEAPVDDEVEPGNAASPPSLEHQIDTSSPTTSEPEAEIETSSPTGAPTETEETKSEVKTTPTNAPPTPTQATTTSEPSLPKGATIIPVETTEPVLPEANSTTSVNPTAATKTPVVAGAATISPAAADITAETATPGELWGINGAGEPSTAASTSTVPPTTEKSGPIETGVLDMTAPPLSEVDSLEGLDMELVTSAVDHMQALQHCDVDTGALIHKLMALGAGGDSLKKELAAVEEDVPFFMSEICPPEGTEGQDIMNRMSEFHKCSLFNLEELIETFPSAAMGVAMRCASAYKNLTTEEEEKGFVPEECIRTIEADGVIGRGLFGLYLYPDRTCPCFEALGKNVPECTADVWPIPINGVFLKTQSCLIAQYCQSLDSLCERNLAILKKCLPSEDVKARDIACNEVFYECKEIYDNVPPMLNAAPLPDACVRVAEGSKFYGEHIVERYNTFRHSCGNNLELWEGHTPVAEFMSFITDGVNSINLQGFDFLSGMSGGFLLGILFCIAFVVVCKIFRCICSCLRRCCCCCRRKKIERPRTKDYDTVDTEGEDVPEYRD